MAVEISSQLLKTLKNIAEDNCGQKISKAVITVPAYFDEAARNATKQSATMAGLEVLRLINEPTAAAVAYGLDQGVQGTFLVFDLGGGTFDVSILELSQGVFKVVGVGGDASLGGDDFDDLIVQKIIKDYKLDSLSIVDLQNIKLAGKNLKEQISGQDFATTQCLLKNKIFDFELSREEFLDLSQSLVAKIINITQDLLEDLDLGNDQIKAIILVGGSTRMSVIKEKLIAIFGVEKILDNINPDNIVALGAAIQAEALTSRNSNNLLLDVIPLSLGLEIMGGLVDKIIERNSTIPTCVSKEFTTYIDGQSKMKFHIVQGERELVKNCRSLATFEIKNIPALKAGVARIKVSFTVDADGLLTVSAFETITKIVQTIEINPSFGLNEHQIKKMLLDSLKNSQDDIENRLLVELKVEAERNILAFKAALKEDKNLLDSKTLKNIREQIIKLEQIIKSDNKKLIDTEVENLEKFAAKFAEIKMNQEVIKSLVGKKIDEI